MSISFNGKRILLGVSGSIAAYKAAELTRLLVRHDAQVQVVMTDGARQFVTELSFQALSGKRVHTSLLDADAEAAMGHIELARWAQQILIAPASATTLARLANGLADDLLSAVVLASPAPVAVAPAMNQQMWADQATQENIQRLRQRDVELLGPASGEQACGDVGFGRMLEASEILELLHQRLFAGPLQGLHVLITAGPTQEPIDPVRYIGNRSSGKMGYALARAAERAGAKVHLISGPTALTTPARVTRSDVITAQQMHDCVHAQVGKSDIFISVAAVADYRPAQPRDEKIKKSTEQITLNLIRNPDIVSSVTALSKKPFTVGFAAETSDVEGHAQAKLQRKGLDMIAANDVADGQAFGQDQNALLVLWHGGERRLTKTDKDSLARQLIELVASRYQQRKPILTPDSPAIPPAISPTGTES